MAEVSYFIRLACTETTVLKISWETKNTRARIYMHNFLCAFMLHIVFQKANILLCFAEQLSNILFSRSHPLTDEHWYVLRLRESVDKNRGTFTSGAISNRFCHGGKPHDTSFSEGHLYISFSFIWYLNALQLFILWFLELLLIARLASDCWARIGMFHE